MEDITEPGIPGSLAADNPEAACRLAKYLSQEPSPVVKAYAGKFAIDLCDVNADAVIEIIAEVMAATDQSGRESVRSYLGESLRGVSEWGRDISLPNLAAIIRLYRAREPKADTE